MIIHSDIEKEENFDDSKLCRICYDDYNEDEPPIEDDGY